MVEAKKRIPVGILGATGTVGQRLVERLCTHSWFELCEVGASQDSAGRPYGEAATWRLPGGPPSEVATMPVKSVEDSWKSRVLFSALDASVAATVELAMVRKGHAVVSNARAYRLDPDVPLLIPEVNAEHLALVTRQEARWPGLLVTNPNCSVIGFCLAVAPLHRAFGIRAAHVVTLQSLSGAGYPGVSALDVTDNLVPFIDGEEKRLVEEPHKILGRWTGSAVELAEFAVSAQVHRVPVQEGHQLAISLTLDRQASIEDVEATLSGFRGRPQQLGLPSAPRFPIHVLRERDRPQPRLDRDCEGGMAVTVGQLRPCPVLDIRFSALVHNTIRGAAGAAILNAELALAEGLLPSTP